MKGGQHTALWANGEKKLPDTATFDLEPTHARSKETAQAMRDHYAQFFMKEGKVPWQWKMLDIKRQITKRLRRRTLLCLVYSFLVYVAVTLRWWSAESVQHRGDTTLHIGTTFRQRYARTSGQIPTLWRRCSSIDAFKILMIDGFTVCGWYVGNP